nr:hypothetical protein CFP56_41050 [Quercus suber]
MFKTLRSHLAVRPSSVLDAKTEPSIKFRWCFAPRTRRWWLKRRTSIPSLLCVSQPNPCRESFDHRRFKVGL